jgi:hypothetical protein
VDFFFRICARALGLVYKSVPVSKTLTFCWRHSLQARLTAVLRRDDDEGRVSPSPLSASSSVEADRLNPLCGFVGLAKECGIPGVVGDMEAPTDIAWDLGSREGIGVGVWLGRVPTSPVALMCRAKGRI